MFRAAALTQQEIVVGRDPQADYRKVGIEQGAFGAPLCFELQVDRQGRASVEIRSEQPVAEPFVDLVVELRWPTGRLVKQYTLLLDLPPR